MAYTITTTAGATLASIADGTVNSTNTSLTLIGKNYAGYGIFLNENYIKLWKISIIHQHQLHH